MSEHEQNEQDLHPRHQRFVEEYCRDWNATQAAIRAGYSEKTAYSQGSRLLKKDEVQRALAREQDRLSERTRVSQDRIMKELARTGFSDMRSFAQWDGEGLRFHDSESLSADDSPAIREVSSVKTYNYSKDGDLLSETVNTKVTLHDKKAALELMGRRLGMFKDQLNLTNDRPFVVRLTGLGKPEKAEPEGAE